MFRTKLNAKTMGLLMFASSPMALSQNAMAQDSGSLAGNDGIAFDKSAHGAAPEVHGGIEEIVVTARRFAETAQKTSLILSVLNRDDLDGITDVRQLQTLDPGVQTALGGGIPQTYIRGVGTAVITTGQEASVAYNADGVFLFSPLMISPLLYDLERIEVLKGPQGTLYGRGASGGAINIITAGAKLREIEGFIEGELGNFERWRVAGAMNLPLGDTFAVRFAGQHVQHDGYLSDGTDDQKMTSGRLRLLWAPSPAVTLRLGADVSHMGGKGPGSSIRANPTNDKWIGGLDPRLDTGPFFLGGTSLITLPPLAAPFLDNDQWSVNAQLDFNLGFATLTVLPAYRHMKASYLNFVPGFQDRQKQLTKEKTIEVRLANRGDMITWVLGTYFIDNDQSNYSDAPQEMVNAHLIIDSEFINKSYAFFGEATVSINSYFRLIGGVRYTHEDSKIYGANNNTFFPNTDDFNPFDPMTNPTGDIGDYLFSGRRAGSAITWRSGAELDVSSNSLLFATASRGFKGGGIYSNAPGQPFQFDPEYVTAFEFGSRNRFLSNTLQVNAEIFYWRLKDQQHTFLAQNPSGTPALATVNAGRAHMYGASLDVVWQPTRNDRLHGAVEYTGSNYDSFVRFQPAFTLMASSLCDVTLSGPSPFDLATTDCSGKPVVRAPKWVASAGYERSFNLANDDKLIVAGDMTYGGGRWTSLLYTPLSYQDSYALFNASLSYEATSVKATLTAWIRNIADKRVMATADHFIDNYTRPVLAPPRTVGATLHYSF